MFKKIVLKSIAVAMLLHSLPAFAEKNTPIETFIRQVKTNSTFTEVSTIWSVDNNFDQTELLKNVEKAQPLLIDYTQVATLVKDKTNAITLVLPGINGGTFTLELARYDFFTNNFEAHSMAGTVDTKIDYTPGVYYRGVVKGVPHSVAAFSFFNNEVYGVFSMPDMGNFVVVPNTMVGKEYAYNQHYILYNDLDIKFKDKAPVCGADLLNEQPFYTHNAAAKTTTTVGQKVFNNCKEVECFETADYAMYQKKGNSTTNCINYLTSLFNVKSTLYKNEGVPVNLKYIQVNSASDPYGSLPTNTTPSSGYWLSKFGWVTQNTMHGCDVATLFTTKGGYMGGVAWLGTMCHSYYAPDSAGPYAFCNIDNSSGLTVTPFPTYSWDVEVSTHEMGHNLGSPHTHRCCWNPPARNTAIDGCYATVSGGSLEGTCAMPSPAKPPTGGTIMSYCHLTSVGINFSYGFGTQPGDTVRYFIAHTSSSCGDPYNPARALRTANRTITATSECTDMTSNVTYYWKDNSTASHDDDTAVLMIKKNGNDIGDLNDTAFAVSTTTLTGWGSSGVVATFPTGTVGVAAGANNYAMRRYWKVKHTGAATFSTPVDVIFPFSGQDTIDVNATAPGSTAPLKNFRFYTVKPGIDPNPANAFPTANAGSFVVNSYAASLAVGKWISYGYSDTAILAYFKVSALGGGGGFYSPGPIVEVETVLSAEGVDIFPNPTTNSWNILLKDGLGSTMDFQLYTADGRLCRSQVLTGGGLNSVDAADLPSGMYFYRIVSGEKVLTGNVVKN